jgi:hypothetical protein
VTDHIKTLQAIRSAFEGIPSPCDERAALDAAIAALRAQPSEPQGREVEWVAQNFGDYWIVEVRCDKPRYYSIRKSDGQLLELPHRDSPFIPHPFTAPAGNAGGDYDRPLIEPAITNAQCEAVYDAVTRSNFTRDVKTPERKQEVVRAALAEEVAPSGQCASAALRNLGAYKNEADMQAAIAAALGPVGKSNG